ncbi:MAG TPA: tyrosinase family protein [Ohtaekwangia sp.]
MRIKTFCFWVFILVCQYSFLQAQIIRKNYREMTEAEKQILREAFTMIGPRVPAPGSGSAVSQYADNHEALMMTTLGNVVIHNVTDFLPWHRWFILYFEKELRSANVTGANKLTLPYWDWTSKYYTTPPLDSKSDAPLWTQSGNLLYQFESAWTLGRQLNNQIQIGTPNELEQALVQTNFTNFANRLEGPGQSNLFHNNGHVFVGGVMVSRRSPGDPAFYLHHAMVDKVWQDWTNLGRVSSFPDEILPNKGSSPVTNFPSGNRLIYNPVPNVSPTSIIDSRASSVKVWYAENGKLILDKYTVNSTEKYYYTGIIEAGSRLVPSVVVDGQTVNYLTGEFIVPNGRNCWFVSGGLQMGSAPAPGSIKLVPGFKAQHGSNFVAKINSAYFTNAAAEGRIASAESGEKDNTLENALLVYPNPTTGLLNITFSEEVNMHEPFAYTLTSSLGNVVLHGQSASGVTVLDATQTLPGLYILTITVKYNGQTKTITRRVSIN